MTAEEWRQTIIDNCIEAGTYKAFFDPVIDTLSGILEKRDEALRQFKASGGAIVVKHTNKGGATNIEQNPLLRAINDLNRDALTYWRELGLTPSGLRKINEDALKVRKGSSFAEILKNELGKK